MASAVLVPAHLVAAPASHPTQRWRAPTATARAEPAWDVEWGSLGARTPPAQPPGCGSFGCAQTYVVCATPALFEPQEETSYTPPPPQAVPEWRRSKGSEGHENGQCKRCAFFSKGRCRNGDDCAHCHLEHGHRRSRRNRCHGAAVQAPARNGGAVDREEEERDDELPPAAQFAQDEASSNPSEDDAQTLSSDAVTLTEENGQRQKELVEALNAAIRLAQAYGRRMVDWADADEDDSDQEAIKSIAHARRALKGTGLATTQALKLSDVSTEEGSTTEGTEDERLDHAAKREQFRQDDSRSRTAPQRPSRVT